MKPTLPSDLLALVSMPTATAQQCRAYLRALAISAWGYHLDDDPRDIGSKGDGTPWQQAAGLLDKCRADCLLHLGKEVVWGIYSAACAAKCDDAARVPVTLNARVVATLLVAAVNNAEADTASDIPGPEGLQEMAWELLGLDLGAELPHIWSSFCEQR